MISPLSQQLFDDLRSVLGAEYVCTSSEALDRYSCCTIPWQSRCSVVVFPDRAEQVAEVVRIAVKHRIPLWPSSTGRNWGYGATLAIEDGAIVMILERMNRILEVNEELAYAVIEPGVTYEQFNAYLKSNNHDLWIDCIDGSAQGSVIGNALERGIGETPYGDHFGNLCGMEVVLPDGQIVQIGAATKDAKTWHTHKWGVGPYLEGLFSQSNFGVVVKSGIWLMPKPESYNSYVFEVRDERHLPKVLDAFRHLALTGVVNTKLHMINDFVSMTILTQRINEKVSAEGPLSAAELADLRKKYGLSVWNCAGGIYGTRAQVRLQKSLLKRTLSPYGRLLFASDSLLPIIERAIAFARKSPVMRKMVEKVALTSLPVLESAPYVHKILQGIPTDYFIKHAYYRNRQQRPEEFNVNPAMDRCGLIWFAPILPFTNQDVWPFLEKCKERFLAQGFDFYVAMLLMNPRSVICLMAILYDREDQSEIERSKQLYQLLLAEMEQNQYQQYRAGLQSWGTMYADSADLGQLNNQLKNALDPANILSPGHYGIGCFNKSSQESQA